MKSFINTKLIFKFFFLLILFFITLEIISKIIVYFGYGHLKKPINILRDDNLNSYVQLLEKILNAHILTLFSTPLFRLGTLE